MRLSTYLRLAAATLVLSPAAMAQTDKTISGGDSSPATAANFAPPPNDNFANAYVATAAGLQTLSTTAEATIQAGEPTVPAACATGDANRSVWYRFTGNGMPVTLDLDGSVVGPAGPVGQFTDTIMSIYTGATLTSLTLVACNDDDPTNTLPGDFTSRIANQATIAGTVYHVRVSSYFGGNRDIGEVRLTITGGVTTAGEGTADNARSSLTAFPNPVRDGARVRFTTAATQDVTVAVYDVTGRQVATLFSGLAAADQEQTFDLAATSLPSGVYVVRALGTTVDLTQRVTVVR